MKRTAFVLMLLMTSMTGLVAGLSLSTATGGEALLNFGLLGFCLIGTAGSILVYQGEK